MVKEHTEERIHEQQNPGKTKSNTENAGHKEKKDINDGLKTDNQSIGSTKPTTSSR